MSSTKPKTNKKQKQKTNVATMAGPDPDGRTLSPTEDANMKQMPTYSSLHNMLHSFGYGADDMRINAETGKLLLPLEVATQLERMKKDCATCFSEISPSHLGMLVKMRHLSVAELNERTMRIVKVFPDEAKIAVDATCVDAPPEQVRYVKVPADKVATIFYPVCDDGLNVRSVMNATNRDKAFKRAGFKAADAECLPVRQHAMIERGRMFRDLPELCVHLNTTKAQGHPFTLDFGYQIFADGQDAAVLEMMTLKKGQPNSWTYESSSTAEPYIILRDARGNGIDVSPDLADGSRSEYRPALFKVFMPDPRFTLKKWQAMFDAVDRYVVGNWFPSVPAFEALINHGTSEHVDCAINLGMVPDDLNRQWPDESRKCIMVHPFFDSLLRFPHKENFALHARTVQMRRNSVNRGAVLLSSNLAAKIAANHEHDDLLGGQLLSRLEIGTVCFACYTRLTVEEAMTCEGCGQAHYCSRGCQLVDWQQHKKCCASPVERRQRREAAAKAAAERQEQLRRHDERTAREQAERAAEEADRRAKVAASRADRLQRLGDETAERIRRAAPATTAARGGPKDKSRKANRSLEEQLLHVAWSSTDERAARTAAFAAKQEAEHLEAEARKAAEKYNAMKQLQAQASAHAALASQAAPSGLRLQDFVKERMF